MDRRLTDIHLEDISIDNIEKHQKQLIKNITAVLHKTGGKLFSNDNEAEEQRMPVNKHLRQWIKEMERSDTAPKTHDPLLDRMKSDLANTESEIVEIRKILRSENNEIIKQFKKEILAMIEERRNNYEYTTVYSKQFAAIVEMIMALKVDSILSQPYSESPNLLYGTYIFLQGGMPYYASILSTSIALQVVLLHFLLGHLPVYKIYNDPRTFDEGTLMPENMLDLLYVHVKRLDLESMVSDIVYELYNILPTPSKIDKINLNILSFMNKDSFSDEIEAKSSATLFLYYLMYLMAISGSIFDMLCFSIKQSKQFNKFMESKHAKYNIEVLNAFSYVSSDLFKAINIITKMRLPVYASNLREFKRILDAIENESLAQFMYNNIDALLKIYTDYRHGGIALLRNELNGRDAYETGFAIVSNSSINLSKDADYYKIVTEIKRILASSEDRGVLHLDLNYSIPFFNFEPGMLKLNNKYIEETYLILLANLELNLNIDYHKFLR